MNPEIDRHLEIIFDFYGNRTAERSGLPLTNHIVEGLKILNLLLPPDDDTTVAHCAWCIHPIIQGDAEFHKEMRSRRLANADPWAIMLATEYRNFANSYLSTHRKPQMKYLQRRIRATRFMRELLIADKIQNKKDFYAQPKGTYENQYTLIYYFEVWLSNYLWLSHAEIELYEGLITDGKRHVSTHDGSGEEKTTDTFDNGLYYRPKPRGNR